MGARAALACALLAGMLGVSRRAHADRRPVAVVNLDLAPKSAGADIATRLDRALDQNPRLARVPDPGDERALREYLAPEDEAPLRAAATALDEARADLARYDLAAADRVAGEGLAALRNASPGAAAAPYAELAFELGVARLGEGKPADAAALFGLVHRLAPDQKLADDLLPEVVTAFEHARPVAGAATAQLEVRGHGHAWIDGAAAGDAPGVFPVAPGLHWVELTGDARESRGAKVEVPAGAVTPTPIDVPDAPLSRERTIYRARAALATAVDADARETAAGRLATLVGVADVVVIDVAGDKTSAETWQPERGFERLYPPAGPMDVLDALAPPPPRPPDPPHVRPPPPPPPLYKRRWFQGSVATAVVGAIATGVWLAGRQGTIVADPDLHIAPR